jgi:hypothetical protein
MRFMQKTIWAITPEMMETMAEIAYETRKSPEAIAKVVNILSLFYFLWKGKSLLDVVK